MKKNLLTVALLALSLTATAQSVICSVNKDAVFYVGKNALVYNGGGFQTKDSGTLENHGNVMVVGGVNDSFRTLDAAGLDITEGSTSTSFINKLNDPANYASPNSSTSTTAPVYTYGQLYISGLVQGNITGIINQEYRQVSHGAYQQMGFPFYDKTASTLSTELGKTFTNVRRSENEVLRWNNSRVVFDNLPNMNFKLGKDNKPYTYYSLGGKALNVSTITRTLKGRPVADFDPADTSINKIQLKDAGDGMNFGVNGSAINEYGGRYNTYLQDGFEISSGGIAWQGNFGKNLYQFGNPYLTNLDLSQIATGLDGTPGDGNNLTNIYGVRLEVSGVQFNPTSGGGSTSVKAITYNTGVATGDVDYQVIRPFGTFVVKLNNNTDKPVLDFSTLRRFNYHPRTALTGYSVTAAKGASENSTVKQLGVIGLDANGNEVGRTYYVVSANTVSGNSNQVKAQIGYLGGLLGTYEEDAVNGGYDNNHISYWLYLNEANETDFKGKNIKLVNYNSNIVSFKFEIRENAEMVADGVHSLSQGEGFYFRKETESTAAPVSQNEIIATVPGNYDTGVEYNLYYGKPADTNLGTGSDVNKSSTIVVFNSEKDNYFVLFDREWKSADIQVYDMSGRLVHNKLKVSASSRYELPLQKGSAGYIVHITSDKGQKVVTKILR